MGFRFGQTGSLTAGVDNLTGSAGNDTFTGVFDGTTATLRTLSAGDAVNGGAGVDTLNVIVANNAAVLGISTPLAGVAVSNVENISVQNVGADGVAINVQPIAGVTTVTAKNGTAIVDFQNLAAGTTVVASGAAQTGNVAFNQLVTSDAVSVQLDGGVSGITVRSSGALTDGGAGVADTLGAAAGTATSATITSTGGNNGYGAAGADILTLTGGTNTLTKLTVNATTDLRATLTAADFAAAGADLTVSGAAARVNLGTAGVFKTIDASGLTAGGVTVGLQSVTSSFKGGAGNDTVTNNAAGNAVISSGASIDGGAGVDTVAATLINAGNSAVFKNFEQIDLTGMAAAGTLDASLLTNSTITGVVINGAVGAAANVSSLVETASGFNVAVTGSNTAAATAATLGFTSASVSGSSDVLNYNFGAADAAVATNIFAGTITSNRIEKINIASNGGLNISNQLTVTDVDAQTITITGNKALTLAVTAQTASPASTTVTQLTKIDGSAATGNLTITENGAAGGAVSKSAVTILGGSGNDLITVSTSAAGTNAGAPTSYGGDTVTTGAGNDTVNVAGATAQVNTAAFAMTTITDFAKGDALQFGAATTFTAAKVDVSAQTTLLGAITAATSAAATTAQWFQYGGNTYVVDNTVAASGFDAADVVVKITGLVDLSTSTGTGTNTITFA